MSSTVRGSFESNTSSNSNKRKRLPINQNPSMHQDLNDHLLQNQQEEEAAALLNHMHLMHHHPDHHHHPHLSPDRMHIDPHPAQYAPAVDHPLMPRRLAGENSGSSDASAAYFSGDSDLTAERPIMGCAADDEGAKSSNSAGSTPFKLPQAAPHNDPAQANPVCGQKYIHGNLPSQNDIANNTEQTSRTSTPPLPLTAVAPSTSTSSRNYEIFPHSDLLPSSQMMQMRGGTPTTTIGGSVSPLACANFVKDSESSWLDLRLGFSTEPCGGALRQNYEASTAGVGRESSVEASDITPVTLQLLPEKPSMMEACSGAGRSLMPSMMVHESPNAAGSGMYGSLPPIYYHPFSHMGPNDRDHPQIPGAAASDHDHQQYLLNQSKDPTAFLNYLGHQQILVNQNNDPSPVLHQSHRHLPPAGTRYDPAGRIVYDQVQAFSEFNDRRGWPGTAEMSEMMMIATQPIIKPTQTTEGIRPPTANSGWPSGAAMVSTCEPRAWSAANPYPTPPAQLQGTMSWQGLLRSMATDPLMHTNLPELSMRNFEAGVLETSTGPQRRNAMFPSCASRPPSSHAATPGPINSQRLRLCTSMQRDTGLWFSLQEADHFLNENVETHQEQFPNQPMQKVYLRIRDGKMQISVIKSYLIKKLGSSGAHQYNNNDEVEITCRGKVLAPTLTIQHVRDTIWLNNENGEAIGFKHTNRYLSETHNAVMALFYQKHYTQTITLNLLKT